MEQTAETVRPTPETAPESRPQPTSPSPLPSSERDLRWRSASRSPGFRRLLILILIVLLVVGFFLWRYFTSYESTDDAQIDGHLNAISARISGHVEKLLVDDNQYVNAGTSLVQIDPRDYQVAVDRAKAEQQITQAQSKLAQAEANLRSASTAPQQVAAIRSRAQSALAQVQFKKAALEQAELNLQYTSVVAPVNGVVTNRTVEVGQNVQPGQELMRIINLDDIWVTANFKETQLRQMQVGQPVTIAVDSNGKKYKGHVQSIAGASGSITSLLPPENATGNYVKVVQRIPVKITFDPGETKENALRPGMSVEPKVWIRLVHRQLSALRACAEARHADFLPRAARRWWRRVAAERAGDSCRHLPSR